ncbi:hypothetical protein I5Q34_04820 [Streptomyces sp. AV19]|uniref:hypothetical protein n=1 Tax=Streptomyces sp. AV19 TaxID=2793068 RepID=UPI0018FEF29B|nr:hypothetical protein [Streptomyces sp. AV19]MBH1933621.1 hypothetical protein [Streptomyces sp. AV19]MDG4535874.1 hypothetical protein [Streptomyces sp. AV19]
MDYRQLFSDIRRRPNSYGLDGSFREAVAFINGCDAGNAWGLLVGFREWLAIKADCEANLAWPLLILRMAQVPAHDAWEINETDEVRAIDSLFEELDSFLSARNGAHGASAVFMKYLEARAR